MTRRGDGAFAARRPLGTQLGAQQLAQQRVVGEPASGAAERGHHRVAPYEVCQPGGTVTAFGERVGQVAGEGVDDRGPQQEGAQVRGLAVKELAEEIVGHRPVRRGEGGDVRLGLGMVAQRERGQPQRRGPALGATAEHRDLVRVQRRARLPEQRSGLVLAEGQMALTDLAQPVREAQPRKAQRWVLARHEDEPQRRRRLRQQPIEVGGHLAAVDLVEVVEHEDHGLLALGQRVAQPVQRRRQVAAPGYGDVEAEGRRDEAPEAVAVRITRVQGRPRHRARRRALGDPGRDHDRLAGPGRGGHQRERPATPAERAACRRGRTTRSLGGAGGASLVSGRSTSVIAEGARPNLSAREPAQRGDTHVSMRGGQHPLTAHRSPRRPGRGQRARRNRRPVPTAPHRARPGWCRHPGRRRARCRAGP